MPSFVICKVIYWTVSILCYGLQPKISIRGQDVQQMEMPVCVRCALLCVDVIGFQLLIHPSLCIHTFVYVFFACVRTWKCVFVYLRWDNRLSGQTCDRVISNSEGEIEMIGSFSLPATPLPRIKHTHTHTSPPLVYTLHISPSLSLASPFFVSCLSHKSFFCISLPSSYFSVF